MLAILTNCGVPFFLDILNSNDEETLNASSYVIQLILDSLSDANVMKKVKELRKNPRMMTSDERKWCNKVENERIDLIRSEYWLHEILNGIFLVLVEIEKRRKAADNLVYLAKDKAGAKL